MGQNQLHKPTPPPSTNAYTLTAATRTFVIGGSVGFGSALNQPATFELWDHQNEASPVLVGTVSINSRQADYTFEDAELAAEIGAIQIWQSLTSITYGAFEFGVMLMVGSSGLTDSGLPLHQVFICCKPTSAVWPGYPAMTNYNRSTNTTFPLPWKGKLKTASGATLAGFDSTWTFSMRDGLPINSTSLSQTWAQNFPLRPDVNCAQWPYWENTTTRASHNAAKYHNGIATGVYRHSQTKQNFSANGAFPMYAGRFQLNSINEWYALPQWPQRNTIDYGSVPPDVQAADPQTDTYLYNRISTYPPVVWLTGWDYEPGSVSGHDWYTGPGGVRFDRGFIATPYVLWRTDPTFTVLQGNTPILDRVRAWGKGYFNHSCYWVTDAKTFATIPNARQWTHAHGYYGGGPYASDPADYGPSKTVDMAGIPNGGDDANSRDASGRYVWNGYLFDYLHGYPTPGWHALLLNSPAHAIATKWHYNRWWISTLGFNAPTTSPYGFYASRFHAWRFLHYAMSWKLASTHALGLSRATIEGQWQTELEALYDQMYVPAFVNNDTVSPSNVALRNFGNCSDYDFGANANLLTGGTLGFYMTGVFSLMKQTGSWAAMRAKSAKCKTALDMVLTCLDKMSIDYLYYTHGAYEEQSNTPCIVTVAGKSAASYSGAEVLAGWPTYGNTFPPSGLKDFMHDTAGALTVHPEWYVAQHNRAQWCWMRRDFSLDDSAAANTVNPRLSATLVLLDNWYSSAAAAIALQSTPSLQTQADFVYAHPQAMKLKAPP